MEPLLKGKHTYLPFIIPVIMIIIGIWSYLKGIAGIDNSAITMTEVNIRQGLGVILWVLSGLFVLFYGNSSISVDNSRIYGHTTFFRKIDIPVSNITAVSKLPLKTIKVEIDSGNKIFPCFSNDNEIYETISNLITSKSNSDDSGTPTNDLRELKQLLDDGILTQEEFDAKKKEILGL